MDTPIADAAPVTPVTESAPLQTTTDIAAAVDHHLNAETGRPSAIDATRAPGEVGPTPTPEVPLSPAAAFLLKQGHKLKKDDGRDNWLPAKTIEGMLDRYMSEHRTTWDTERGTLDTARTTLQQQIDHLKRAVAGDPRAFLAEIAQMDPRYQAFLEAPAPAPSAARAMPAPDVRLADGSATYSIEGLKQLLEWNTQQVEAKLLPQVDERLKPWAEREKEAQARQEQDRLTGEMKDRYTRQMGEAQTWPGFGKLADDGSLTPLQDAVLAELKHDSEAAAKAGRRPSMTLRQAYLEVHARQLAEDDTKRRAQWMKEQNDAPRSTSVTRGGVEHTRPRGPRSTEDIARDVGEQLERGASLRS
jgi:hypothetical protein